MGNIGHSRYQGLRCPHCAGKLPGYVSTDAELARIREQTMADTEVVRLQNQLRGAVEAAAALARALRLTQEYAGDELLPPSEGWSWYDALKAHGHYEGGQ